MEDLVVIDWSKRISTHADVRLFLKKLTKLLWFRSPKNDRVIPGMITENCPPR